MRLHNPPMARRLEFVPCWPKRILNKEKRADHWFWTPYSAYPYRGCQHVIRPESARSTAAAVEGVGMACGYIRRQAGALGKLAHMSVARRLWPCVPYSATARIVLSTTARR
jgi:hypothetical protein